MATREQIFNQAKSLSSQVNIRLTANKYWLGRLHGQQVALTWLETIAILVGLSGVVALFAGQSFVVTLVARIVTATGLVLLSACTLVTNKMQRPGISTRLEIANKSLWQLRADLTDLMFELKFSLDDGSRTDREQAVYARLQDKVKKVFRNQPVPTARLEARAANQTKDSDWLPDELAEFKAEPENSPKAESEASEEDQ